MDNTDNKLIDTKHGKLTRKQKNFIDNLLTYTTLNDAALHAGYSQASASNIKSLIRQSPILTNAIKDLYTQNNIARLHDIMTIEGNVLEHCKDINNVDNVPKHAQTLKQIKQAAGVLDIEPTAKSITININAIEKIQVAMADVLRQRMIPVHSDDDACTP